MSGALLLLAQVSAVLAVLSAAAHEQRVQDCVQLLATVHIQVARQAAVEMLGKL